MTLVLSERDVQDLVDMKDIVASVEEAFRREGLGEASNSMRTRSKGAGSLLNVMHANLAYLGRGGVKAYMASRGGARFVFVLFDAAGSLPLAVMGADVLGRYRTGAASAVATKHLCPRGEGKVAIFGSGKQALTQVLALAEVMTMEEVRVWSPVKGLRDSFVRRLSAEGYQASAHESPESAASGGDVASAITSSSGPFLTDRALRPVKHLNLCGSNSPARSEAAPAAIGSFDAVVVDDIAQARAEYGDLILAERAGAFSWEAAVELGAVVAGRARVHGRTLFKSGGAALEDVATASALNDRAVKSGGRYADVSLG